MAKRMTAQEVRKEAYRMAKDAAKEREKEGDPEGADVIRDLAASIREINISRKPRAGHGG